jgi:hypothetical protein
VNVFVRSRCVDDRGIYDQELGDAISH